MDNDDQVVDGRIGRRKFARQLVTGTGLVAASTLLIPAAATTAVGAEVPPPPSLPEPADADAPDKASEPPPEVLLMTYLVRAYPSDHFDEQAVQGIFRDIRGDIARGQILNEFSLKNSDEPAFVFSPYRSTEGTPTDR